MPHGTPDFQQTSGVNTVYQLTDMAELAARLGSIVSFERRGDVFFLEDFEHGAGRFSFHGNGAGYAGYLSLNSSKSKHFSARLVSGSNGDHNAYIYTNSGLPSISKVGFEVSFAGGSVLEVLEMTIEPCDGSVQMFGIIKYDYSTKKLYYYDEDDAWIEFASGISMPVSGIMYNTAKLVVDVAKREYVRFVLNATTYPLLGIACNVSAGAVYPQCYSEFKFTGQNGFNQSMYLDDWILTQNE